MSTPFVAVTPGPDLSEADHALLVRIAWSRARVRMLGALAVIATGALAIGVLAALHQTLGSELVAVLCAAVVVAAAVTAARMPAQQQGLTSLPLMSGADRGTRRQVLRAVRRGVPVTGRLAVLADDCAQRIVRRRCVPVTYGSLAVLLLVVAGVGVLAAMPLTFSLVVLVGGLGMAGAATAWVVLIGRAQRYLTARG